MKIVGDSITTQKIDEYIEKEYKVSKDILMENVVFKLYENIDINFESYLIVAGFGNNGGDGYALARMLHANNKDVIIFKIDNDYISNECKLNYERCLALGIRIIDNIDKLDFYLQKTEVVVDAIFGIGLNKELPKNIKDIVYKINKYKYLSQYKVYSIDIPTGLDSKYGNTYGACIEADITLSIMTYKNGFLNYSSRINTGEIKVIKDIILPNKDLKRFSNIFIIEKNDIKSIEIKRREEDNKTTYGKTFIVAGSKKYFGAAKLAAKSCVKCGSGYTYLLSDFEGIEKVVESVPEVIYERDINNLDKATTIAIGPGMEFNEYIYNIIEEYKDNKNLVIDAGALSNKINFNNHNNVIITPHTGEFSRISNTEIDLIKKDPIEVIQNYSRNNKVTVLLKGKNTYISDGVDVYIIDTGNPYMANAGMGDVLTGMISSLNAQGYTLKESAIIGTYLHGYIADELSKKQYIINPTDIIDNIGKYMKELFI
ncbi:bifunctional ADP-dependent NAD(P)H-hydrate dehydratase/NAD(P)H-hydrate epimerase [Streptobacillus felis]|uniref:bifunctional ADP-dependent NAD(P)H-hydrate dehydratase/NAD(P)H-hydrate epimerase n=1 Tax=Streptobacillus felis TaxID=1384509 RepID=UPI00082BE85F|nr:bifunctional ADP-dependent NAD(P)H-hydrate dehydratase/NAD(P)H-hydrate epimerase [Streptobacillus felis]